MHEDRKLIKWLARRILILQIFINAIVSGLSIALLGTAFSVVYLPTRVFHIALGGVFAMVPYLAALGLSGNSGAGILSIVGAIGLGATISILCEVFNHEHLSRKNAPSSMHIISSLGIYIVLIQLISLLWGSQQRILGTEDIKTAVSFSNISLTRAQLVILLTASGSLLAFHLWLRLTGMGLHLRALADCPLTFTSFAGNARFYKILAFGIGGLLASMASLAEAYQFGYRPTGALSSLLLAVAAMIIGGRNHFLGPLIGGLMIGVLRESVAWYLSPRWQDTVIFTLLVLFLFLRPQGLLGRTTRLEAT